MMIKPSTELRNDYTAVSRFAHESGAPIFITKNGEGDLVVMSIETFERLDDARYRHYLIAADEPGEIANSQQETQQRLWSGLLSTLDEPFKIPNFEMPPRDTLHERN
jgi:prevent-host-death family protein